MYLASSRAPQVTGPPARMHFPAPVLPSTNCSVFLSFDLPTCCVYPKHRFHMHDAVEWMAVDPLDIRADEWRQDLLKYAWVCRAHHRHIPEDKAGQAQYFAELLAVKTRSICDDLTAKWENRRGPILVWHVVKRCLVVKPMAMQL